MKIDIIHFMPMGVKGIATEDGTLKRITGGAACWITGESIAEGTPFFFCRHPIKLGVNATIASFPIGENWALCASYRELETKVGTAPLIRARHWDANWSLFKDVLPPREAILSREAAYWEEALLKMSGDYWKDFTRLEPKFAEIVAPAFLESPKNFDELFKKVSVPLAKNFQRDMAIILLWKEWKADWNMTYQKAVADLAVGGFEVDADALRKIRDKYSLPSFKD